MSERGYQENFYTLYSKFRNHEARISTSTPATVATRSVPGGRSRGGGSVAGCGSTRQR